ncbi:sugar transferase [Terricaulis sp.]|uniref:sugar transferase n=1 Tax=Terricaulis sp. TaxID=2768686 RepID=UPI003784F967
MLVQLPPRPERPQRQGAQEGSGFEEALRRDLATAPVVPYDHMVGGWRKRAFDLVVVAITSPIWLLLLGFFSLRIKLFYKHRAIVTDLRVGYGGRDYQAYRLQLDPPKAPVAHLHAKPDETPANDTVAGATPDTPQKRFIALLPQLINVLKGDMSLVGPKPLTHDELDPLKIGKRYYLSARPGLMTIAPLVDNVEEDGPQYKAYALSQSLLLDLLLIWDAAKLLLPRKKSDLWQPETGADRAKLQARVKSEVAARRRRSDASSL